MSRTDVKKEMLSAPAKVTLPTVVSFLHPSAPGVPFKQLNSAHVHRDHSLPVAFHARNTAAGLMGGGGGGALWGGGVGSSGLLCVQMKSGFSITGRNAGRSAASGRSKSKVCWRANSLSSHPNYLLRPNCMVTFLSPAGDWSRRGLRNHGVCVGVQRFHGRKPDGPCE